MESTPGPWSWDGTYPIRILDSRGFVICGEIMPSGEANAHLIVAAPLLLKALRSIVKRSPFVATATGIQAEISFEQIKEAQAALAAVEGVYVEARGHPKDSNR